MITRFGVSRWAFRGLLVGLLAAGACAAILVSVSQAATCDETWTGPGGTTSSPVSGSWGTSTNWSPASVPTGSQNVCLNAGTYTVTVTASQSAGTLTVGGGVTVAVEISAGNGAVLNLGAGTSTNNGTFELTDVDSTGTGSPIARLLLGTGATLTNDGTILSDPGPAGLGVRSIMGQSASSTLNNASDGTITVNQDLLVNDNQAGLFETSGNITIASGKKLLANPFGGLVGGSNPSKDSAEMDINGGTITDNGTFEQGFSETGLGGSAALKVNGGTITGAGLISVSGAPTDLAGSGVGASFSGSGAGTYTFVGSLSANATTLGGTIGANQAVVFSASTADGSANAQVNSGLTNNGTIELSDLDTSGTNQNAADFSIGSGSTLTNNGKIVSDPGPVGAGQRVINGVGASSILDNASGGEIDVNQPLQLDTAGTGTFTTTGTIDVASGQTLEADPGGGSAVFNLDGGTITNNGTAELGVNSNGNSVGGTTFNINGGTVTGHSFIAALANTTFSGAGSGAFTLAGATSIFGGGTIAGTIGSNDAVTLSANSTGTGSAVVTSSGAVVNDGTFTMTDTDTSPSGGVFSEVEIPSNSSFTNQGTMTIAPGPDASGYRSIDGTLSNAGTLNVNMLLQLALHGNSGIDNTGTTTIAAGQGIYITGGTGTYTQTAGTTSVGAGSTLAAPALLVSSGSVTGSGTICGPGGTQSAPCGSGSTATDLTNDGTITPSPSPSTLTLEGNYVQGSTGTLDAQVTSSGNDQLAIAGSGDTATLGGTLAVSTASGFTPPTGHGYQVLTAPGGVSGTFATTSGLSSGPYRVSYNATNVTLTAVTSAAGIHLAPSSMTFGSPSNTVAAGSTVHQTLTISDDGTASLVLGTLSLTGSDASSYSLSSDNCSGHTIAVGNSCTVSVDFSPAAAGTDSAAVSVPDNVTGSPQHVPLTGYAGVPGPRVTLSERSIDFGLVGVGVESAKKDLTVTNPGTAGLNVASLALSGPDASEFKIASQDCTGRTIAPGGVCTIGLTLTAGATGVRSGSLRIADNAPNAPQSVPLTGTASTSGTLSGRVMNGGVSPATPLGGASVTACLFNTHGSCQTATTGPDGNYSISGLAPGVWQIQVDPPKPYLFATGSVLQIVAGLNSRTYFLRPPIGLSNGISVNGQTSGFAGTRWQSPATVQAPIKVPASGPAGTIGVATVQFWVQPLSDTLAAPFAVGSVSIYYQFDSSGVPKFLAQDVKSLSSPSGSGPSIGTWQTSVTTGASPYVPVAGDTVSNYRAQGVFVPPPAGPDYHGALYWQVHQWSLFVAAQGTTAATARAQVHTADSSGATLGEADSCEHGAQSGNTPDYCSPTPNPPPGDCPSTSSPQLNFTLSQGGGGSFDLGDGATWDSGTRTLILPGNVQINLFGGFATLYEPGGDPNGSQLPPGSGLGAFGYNGQQLNGTVNPDGSVTYDGFTVYPNGEILAPNGAKYGLNGNQIAGPAPSSNCPKPPLPYNYWNPFDGWTEPSGIVRSTKRIPVASAKVVLVRSNTHGGPFTVVPGGSLFMSPGNRRNPDHTTALGAFGWDVVPGYYRVSAHHAGCRSPAGGARVISGVLRIPPAVTNVKLTLKCRHLRRSKSRTKLRARRVPVGEVALVAIVHGRHPQGTVTFRRGHRKLGVVTLGSHSGRAVFSTRGTSTTGFRARYSGDGHNAPSSGRS